MHRASLWLSFTTTAAAPRGVSHLGEQRSPPTWPADVEQHCDQRAKTRPRAVFVLDYVVSVHKCLVRRFTV